MRESVEEAEAENMEAEALREKVENVAGGR